MSNKQPAALIKNDHSFTILVTIGRDDYVVPPHAWLQSGCDEHIYLSLPGDAPMRAVPIGTGTPYNE